MNITRQLWNFRLWDPILATKKHIRHKITFVPYVPLVATDFSENRLLTFAIPAVAAEVAAAGVLELAVAFGADADHVGHDGAGDGFLGVVLFARDGAGGVGEILDAAHRDHDALRNRLFG